MLEIVVSEFMDPEAIKAAAADYELFYDPDLVDDLPRLASLLTETRSLVVRNRTRMDRRLLEAALRLDVHSAP